MVSGGAGAATEVLAVVPGGPGVAGDAVIVGDGDRGPCGGEGGNRKVGEDLDVRELLCADEHCERACAGSVDQRRERFIWARFGVQTAQRWQVAQSKAAACTTH